MKITFNSKEAEVIKSIVRTIDPSAKMTDSSNGAYVVTDEQGIEIGLDERYITGLGLIKNELIAFINVARSAVDLLSSAFSMITRSKGYSEYKKTLDAIHGVVAVKTVEDALKIFGYADQNEGNDDHLLNKNNITFNDCDLCKEIINDTPTVCRGKYDDTTILCIFTKTKRILKLTVTAIDGKHIFDRAVETSR